MRQQPSPYLGTVYNWRMKRTRSEVLQPNFMIVYRSVSVACDPSAVGRSIDSCSIVIL